MLQKRKEQPPLQNRSMDRKSSSDSQESYSIVHIWQQNHSLQRMKIKCKEIKRGGHCNITITAWSLIEGVNLEIGMWWWPQAGRTATWLPQDPPLTATPWVSSNERQKINLKIFVTVDQTRVRLETLQEFCGTHKVRKWQKN